MKILIRKSDNVVIYAQDDLQLDTEAHGNGWRDPQFNTGNAILDDANPPAGWTGAVWSYTGGVWAVADAVGYAAIAAIAAEEAERARVSKIPRSVTRRQARQALLLRGKLALVQPAINAIQDATQRGLMQIEWDDSLSFDRDRPSLIAIGAAIGYDALGLDDVFMFAATL